MSNSEIICYLLMNSKGSALKSKTEAQKYQSICFSHELLFSSFAIQELPHMCLGNL